MDGRMEGWMDGRIEGWMDGWVDGRMDGWIKEEINKYIKVVFFLFGDFPASKFYVPNFGTLCSIFVGHVTMNTFRCHGLPKRKNTTFTTRRKFEIKKYINDYEVLVEQIYKFFPKKIHMD